MSFLDDQATGQIGIGEKASLSTLTRRRRKRKKGQAPTGSETYSLMPQNEFSNIVSSPTDIQQVGIGNLLQAQGSSAGKVPNVFEEYKSAAPIGSTIDAIYPQPEDDEEDDDDDEGTTDKLPIEIPSHDSGIFDPESGNFQTEGRTITNADGTKYTLAPRATGKTFKEDRENLVRSMQKLIPGGKTGYEGDRTFNQNAGDPSTWSSNTALTDTDTKAYNEYSRGIGVYGSESVGAGTGGSGGSTNMTVADIAAMNAAISASGGLPSSGGSGVGGLPPGVGGNWGGGAGGGDVAPAPEGAPAPGEAPGDTGWGIFASGGTVTKSKAKNKNSFMSMKGK